MNSILGKRIESRYKTMMGPAALETIVVKPAISSIVAANQSVRHAIFFARVCGLTAPPELEEHDDDEDGSHHLTHLLIDLLFIGVAVVHTQQNPEAEENASCGPREQSPEV